MYKDNDKITIMDHPLIKHKITMLRMKSTGTNEFRKLIEEIAVLMGYEALRNLPLENIDIETPIQETQSPIIAGKKPAIVPILRAGLGMVGGLLTLMPAAKDYTVMRRHMSRMNIIVSFRIRLSSVR